MSALSFDLSSLRQAYRNGATPSQMIDDVLARIVAADDPGIFIHVPGRDELMAAAEALGPFDPQKPLWGVPFAVKDNIDVAGMPTTAACPAFAYVADRDAHVVAKLKAAGAIVVGKTNLDQFATGLVGTRTPFPIPRNTIDPTLVPGGSSSGSAVATARGIVSFALGTDTAGSGRVPAGLNNIVGLKPSVGALSTSGLVPACRTLDCISVFALTVDDAYRVFEIAAGPDAADPYSRALPPRPLAARRPGLRIGVPAKADRLFFGDRAMEAGFESALATLANLQMEVVEVPFADFYKTAAQLYDGAWVAERYAAIKEFFDRNENAVHPVTRTIIGGARRLSAAEAFQGFYALQACRARLAPVIASIDVLCVPTAPTHYRLGDVDADPIRTNSRLGTYTNFVNLLDLCGIAVPTGTRRDGLPMSVTLLAKAGEDALVASIARDLHAAAHLPLGATGWPMPAPAELPASPEDGIDIVVVGAHLSGMPLNHQLTDLGARLERATRTMPAYRLYALAGQSVAKPGLLRVAEGAGAAIDVEVWRMSATAFGNFVASLPSPMAIGTVQLADGGTAKGFLVEPAGLDGAADISAYGGWRNYLARARIAS